VKIYEYGRMVNFIRLKLKVSLLQANLQ